MASANQVYQYEQPRCPDNWNEAERRFYNRLIQVLDDIYAKYGRIDEKMLAKTFIKKVETITEVSLDKVVANVISATDFAADSLAVTFADMVSIAAKYGQYDFQTVKNLVADAMVLQQGQGDTVHITNFAATYAQMVDATIGNLCIKASDGNYYNINVDSDGYVTATLNENVSESPNPPTEIIDEYNVRRPVVETMISAETLTTKTLMGTQALLNTITAELIDTNRLTAREAFIQSLTSNNAFIRELATKKILGDTTIDMLVEKHGDVSKWFRFSNEDGLIVRKPEYVNENDETVPKSVYYTQTDEKGYHVRRDELVDDILSADINGVKTNALRIGNMVCRATEDGGWAWMNMDSEEV